jgi:hypothetical protein
MLTVLPEPTADVHALDDLARRLLDADPSSLRRRETGQTTEFVFGDVGVRVINPGTSPDVPPPFAEHDDRQSLVAIHTVLEFLRNNLATMNPLARRELRDRLQTALRVRILADLPHFLDQGVDSAETAAIHADTPWSRRRVRLAQMSTPPLKARTLSANLPDAPGSPEVCECSIENDAGVEFLVLVAMKVEIEHPWSIDPMTAMRMISDSDARNGSEPAATAPLAAAPHGKPPLTAKAHRAQETRWRFLSIRTKGNDCHVAEFPDRTAARAFARWLLETRTVRAISLWDRNQLDSGEGWADPD